MQVSIELRTVACGTEVNICQSGIPESIPVEVCYLGWQESLKMLPRVVAPDWSKSSAGHQTFESWSERNGP